VQREIATKISNKNNDEKKIGKNSEEKKIGKNSEEKAARTVTKSNVMTKK